MSAVEVAVPLDTLGAFVAPPSLLASGPPDRPLSSLRLGVKDLFDVAGTTTGAGNPTFADTRPPATSHAEAVRRLLAAGASVVGKTITDELAFSLSGTNVHFGTPTNVAAPGRVPGGSSAGSAAAVAGGLVEIALGTDTAGSIRVPASYCGLLGWRPTHGAVPVEGVVPLAPSFDTVGLFARRSDVLELAAAALLRARPEPTVPPLRPVLFADALDAVDPAVADAVRGALVGVAQEAVHLGLDLDEALLALRTRQSWEAWREHGRWIREARPSMGPGIASRFAAGEEVRPGAVELADDVRAALRRGVARATADGTILAMPAAAGPPPPLPGEGDADRGEHERRRIQTLRLTCIASLAGAPVVVVPSAGVGGLPLGVAFVGAPGSDRQLLAWVRGTFAPSGASA